MEQKSKAVHRTVMIAMIAHHMKWDHARATLWMKSKNPHLGNVSPDEMIERDRVEKLYRFIETSIEEGKDSAE